MIEYPYPVFFVSHNRYLRNAASGFSYIREFLFVTFQKGYLVNGCLNWGCGRKVRNKEIIKVVTGMIFCFIAKILYQCSPISCIVLEAVVSNDKFFFLFICKDDIFKRIIMLVYVYRCRLTDLGPDMIRTQFQRPVFVIAIL